jgi:hypothetical protein
MSISYVEGQINSRDCLLLLHYKSQQFKENLFSEISLPSITLAVCAKFDSNRPLKDGSEL